MKGATPSRKIHLRKLSGAASVSVYGQSFVAFGKLKQGGAQVGQGGAGRQLPDTRGSLTVLRSPRWMMVVQNGRLFMRQTRYCGSCIAQRREK